MLQELADSVPAAASGGAQLLKAVERLPNGADAIADAAFFGVDFDHNL
jgi:hypothetical protein